VSVEKFAIRALRGPKRGILEHSLCQHLALAITSEPLRKIRLICEAAFLLDEKTWKEIGINEDDLDVLYRVALAFINSANENRRYYDQVIPIWTVSWSFNKPADDLELYRRYIQPWCSKYTLEYFSCVMNKSDLKRFLQAEEAMRKTEAELEELRRNGCTDKSLLSKLELKLEYCYAVFFFVVTRYLSKQCFNELANMFISWGLPKAQQIFACLSRLVEPALFEEMLGLYRGRAREAEREESVAPTQAVGGPNEGPVG